MVFSQSLASRRQRFSQRYGAFDDPSARQHLDSFGRVGSLDDLDGPVTLPLEGITQFAARIAAPRRESAGVTQVKR